jgi:hypothetical protein
MMAPKGEEDDKEWIIAENKKATCQCDKNFSDIIYATITVTSVKI